MFFTVGELSDTAGMPGAGTMQLFRRRDRLHTAATDGRPAATAARDPFIGRIPAPQKRANVMPVKPAVGVLAQHAAPTRMTQEIA
jgi:hypothetical protein